MRERVAQFQQQEAPFYKSDSALADIIVCQVYTEECKAIEKDFELSSRSLQKCFNKDVFTDTEKGTGVPRASGIGSASPHRLSGGLGFGSS